MIICRNEIDTSKYDAEFKGNVSAFLEVRLSGLMERDAGELFNVETSTLKPEEWLNVSAIVELEVLGEGAEKFLCITGLPLCSGIPESRSERWRRQKWETDASPACHFY